MSEHVQKLFISLEGQFLRGFCVSGVDMQPNVQAASAYKWASKLIMRRNAMHRKRLKLALVESDLTHWAAALECNKRLPSEFQLSEHDITRLVTGRKTPNPEQGEALASVLGVSVSELFPKLMTGEGGAK